MYLPSSSSSKESMGKVVPFCRELIPIFGMLGYLAFAIFFDVFYSLPDRLTNEILP